MIKRAERLEGIVGFGIDRVAASSEEKGGSHGGPILHMENLDTDLPLPPEALEVTRAKLDDPTGYGRIVRTADGKHLEKIVEERDASPEIRQIKEWNSGIYVFDSRTLYPILQQLRPNNDQGEYYLTDVFGFLISHYGSSSVSIVMTDDPTEVAGVNTKDQLSALEQEYYARTA